jgi:hypothetical protein
LKKLDRSVSSLSLALLLILYYENSPKSTKKVLPEAVARGGDVGVGRDALGVGVREEIGAGLRA